MAKLIIKNRYIKGGGHAKANLKYIGTRDGVQTPADTYLEYMSERPRSHGLFGEEDNINMDTALDEMAAYPGNIWTPILSLKREDAARLGYDTPEAWRSLLRAHRNDIAEAFKLPPQNLRWYAAYHDEGHHPHVHMVVWSTEPKQGYLTTPGIEKLRSQLTNQIFQQEMLHVYEQKSVSRNELVVEARKVLREMAHELREGIQSSPRVEEMMMDLAAELGEVGGKKSYGYLPKRQKEKVNEIVNELEQLPSVAACYERWQDLQWQVESYYRDTLREKKRLSEQKEFRSIKNAVIQQAEQIRLGTVTFEDRKLKQYEDADFDDRWASDQYWELKNWIEDDTAELEDRDYAIQEMEQLAKSGDPDAQYYMGTLYRDGPLLIPDVKLAADWFYVAAKQDHHAAQYELGKLLLKEPEVPYPDQGILWMEETARSGNTYAAYRLGKEYLKGQAVERNAEKAVDYFTQAAEGGNQFAQYMLGKLCLMGQGIQQSKEQALYWFTQAAIQGHQHAQYFLDRQDDLKPPSVMLAVTRLLYHMSRIFENTAPVEDSTSMGIQIDRKRLEKLQEKRIALGHKPDDHEEKQYNGPTMSAPW